RSVSNRTFSGYSARRTATSGFSKNGRFPLVISCSGLHLGQGRGVQCSRITHRMAEAAGTLGVGESRTGGQGNAEAERSRNEPTLDVHLPPLCFDGMIGWNLRARSHRRTAPNKLPLNNKNRNSRDKLTKVNAPTARPMALVKEAIRD